MSRLTRRLLFALILGVGVFAAVPAVPTMAQATPVSVLGQPAPNAPQAGPASPGFGNWGGTFYPVGYSDGGVLNQILQNFKDGTGQVAVRAQGVATRLFGALISLELVWFLVLGLRRRAEPADILLSTGFKAVSLGFFAWLFTNSNNGMGWIHWMINGFQNAGENIAQSAITPSDIFSDMVDFVVQMMNFNFQMHTTFGVPNPNDVIMSLLPALVVAISTFLVAVAYVVIAGTLLVFQVEAALLVPIVVFVTAFTGSRWTLPWGQGGINYVVNVGVRLLTLSIILAIGRQVVQNGINSLIATGPPQSILPPPAYYVIAGIALVFAVCAFFIPMVAGSAISGNPQMSLGGAIAAGGVAAIAAPMAVSATGLRALNTASQSVPKLTEAAAGGAQMLGSFPNAGVAYAAQRAAPTLRRMHNVATKAADDVNKSVHGRAYDPMKKDYVAANANDGALNKMRRVSPPKLPDFHGGGGGAGVQIRHHDS